MSGLGGDISHWMGVARKDGHAIHHVTICPAECREAGLPPADYRYGAKATSSVVWAVTKDGQRLIPYRVERT